MRFEAGIVYVPEERGRQGAVFGLPIFQNVSLPSLDRTSKAGVLRLAEELALARTYTQRLGLRASSLSQDIGSLSGGNQQKVIIAKWLATAPKVIILDEPTKGIDIGSKAAVHQFMAELVEQGLSVIMVSSELPEILGMSDRVVRHAPGTHKSRARHCGFDRGDPGPRGCGNRSVKRIFQFREIWLLLAAIFVLLALVGMRFPDFIRPANLVQVFNDTALLIMLALGQMAVIV